MPFEQLTRVVMAAYPGWLPYSGRFDRVVPHLTVADGDAAAAAEAECMLQQRLAAAGSIICHCSGVDWVGTDSASGAWRTRRVIALAPAA